MATDVVGATHDLIPMAIPRPRRIVAEPRSNGRFHSIRSARRSRTASMSISVIGIPVACGDASVLPDSSLEPNCSAVLGDRVELLFHRQRNAHRLSNQESAGGNQRFELDVELAAKSAAQKRRSDTDAIFRPAQEPAHFRPDEGRALLCRMNRQSIWTGHLAD